jgi:hypothetical protein
VIMGIDKIRLISTRAPVQAFIDSVNEDQTKPFKESREFIVLFRNPEENFVRHDTVCRISTRKGVEPGFFLQLNFRAFIGGGIRQIFECNPNKMRRGWLDLSVLLERVFGLEFPDLKISRIDPCADIEMPVEYFRHSLRVPYKRKSTHFGTDDADSFRTFSNRGITGFQIGRSPALLRVYDKREEMRQLREDVAYLPQILTRIEWELRHRKSPISYFSELFQLLDYKPFDGIEIIKTNSSYDFHNDPKNSMKLLQLNTLAEKYGSQEAFRILNRMRNFNRDFRPFVVDSSDIKRKINESYRDGIVRFFNNEGADVRFRYGKQGN